MSTLYKNAEGKIFKITHETPHYVFIVEAWINPAVKSDEVKMTKKKFFGTFSEIPEMEVTSVRVVEESTSKVSGLGDISCEVHIDGTVTGRITSGMALCGNEPKSGYLVAGANGPMDRIDFMDAEGRVVASITGEGTISLGGVHDIPEGARMTFQGFKGAEPIDGYHLDIWKKNNNISMAVGHVGAGRKDKKEPQKKKPKVVNPLLKGLLSRALST